MSTGPSHSSSRTTIRCSHMTLCYHEFFGRTSSVNRRPRFSLPPPALTEPLPGEVNHRDVSLSCPHWINLPQRRTSHFPDSLSKRTPALDRVVVLNPFLQLRDCSLGVRPHSPQGPSRITANLGRAVVQPFQQRRNGSFRVRTQ